jgi:acetyltransferase-like isoleucine patch superfamily enzyme
MNRNLLILGSKGHNRTIKETAQAMGMFEKIDFLEDDTGCEPAIGLCRDFAQFAALYSFACPAFEDGKLRMQWISRLQKGGFTVPVLVHPSAVISPSASIGAGTVIEAMASISTNAVIAEGCIINIGTIVEHDVSIGYASHINSGAIIKAASVIQAFSVIESGRLVRPENRPMPSDPLEANGYSFEVGV